MAKAVYVRALEGMGLMAGALAAQPAAAQQAETPPDTRAEIIVTAQKREQSLQQVPVAVSAIGAAQLETRRLNNIDQLSGIAPNLTITAGNTTTSSLQIAIRGSVTTNVSMVYEPTVGIYVDGVYVGKGSGPIFDIGDLERVEVLRGPQGTLFGRNTLAGAVSFVTRKPSNELRVEGEATYGKYDYRALRGLINVPITDGLYVKVAGQLQRRDGFTKSINPNASGGQDDRRRDSLMAQVRWQPADDWTIDYTYDYSRSKEHPLTAIFAVAPGNIFDPASPYYAGIPAYLYTQQTLSGNNRPKKIDTDIYSTDRSRVFGHALTIEKDFGNASLKSITAYRKVKVNDAPDGLDVDGSPFPIANGGFDINFQQFSQELQLTGNGFGERLNYVLGAFYLQDRGDSWNPQSYFFGGNAFDTSFGVRSRAWAIYGQADYKFGNGFTLTGGLRYTRERKQIDRHYEILALTPNPGNVPLPLTTISITPEDKVRRSFGNLTPTVILAYEFNRDLNVYAKYSVGFRSGGFNGEATSDDAVRSFFKPELNKSFELGLKSRFFDRRLQINVAAFLNKESDKQVPVFLAAGTAATINRNAGRSQIKGLEIEVDARPVDALHIYGSLGLLRTKFKQYLDTDPSGEIVDVASNRYFAKAPRTSVTLGADLTLFDKEKSGKLTVGADMQYQSKTFSLPGQFTFDPRFALVATSDELAIPSSTILNARMRWDDIALTDNGLNAYVMLWVNNLTNYRKVNNKIAFGPNFGGLIVANYHEPLTAGITVGFKLR